VKAPLGNSIKVSTQKDLEEKMEIANQIANLPVRDYVYPDDELPSELPLEDFGCEEEYPVSEERSKYCQECEDEKLLEEEEDE
jgi:hypothetical protein